MTKKQNYKQMKNLKLLLLVFIGIGLFTACDNEPTVQQKEYIITGKVSGATEGFVLIKTRQNQSWVTIDSSTIINEEFIMKGRVDKISFSYLTSNAFNGGIPFFLENSAIQISLHKDSVKFALVTGTESQKIYNNTKEQLDSYDNIWQDFYYNTYRYMTDD